MAAGTYMARVIFRLDNGAGASVRVKLTVAAKAPSPPPTGGKMSATLTWNPNTDPDLAGYNVYVGTASGLYGPVIKVGKVTSYVINDLTAGSTYYFAVTAYDTSNNESLHSAEVSKSQY